jgi:hypothetical protein
MGLVGGFMNLLGLLFTHDWQISVLLAPYYSSDTKTDRQVEISIPLMLLRQSLILTASFIQPSVYFILEVQSVVSFH